jgi:hypothetical protein
LGTPEAPLVLARETFAVLHHHVDSRDFAREISSARGRVERTIRVFPLLGKSSSLTSTVAEIPRHSVGRRFMDKTGRFCPFAASWAFSRLFRMASTRVSISRTLPRYSSNRRLSLELICRVKLPPVLHAIQGYSGFGGCRDSQIQASNLETVREFGKNTAGYLFASSCRMALVLGRQKDCQANVCCRATDSEESPKRV